jgi:hypothetical protein
MNHILSCSKCDEVILKSMGGETKIRGKVITVKEGKVFAVCKGCNSEVQIPLSFDPKVLQNKNLPLLLNKDVDRSKLLK